MSKCEIEGCEDNATVLIRDSQEVFPDDVNVWKQAEPFGPVHSFCNKHKRDSVRYEIVHGVFSCNNARGA